MMLMFHLIIRGRMLLLGILLVGLSAITLLNYSQRMNVLAQPSSTHSQPDAKIETNPLLAKWEGPYGGVPPFDRVQVTQFKPALEAGMAENLAEVERIARDPAASTFDNTITEL